VIGEDLIGVADMEEVEAGVDGDGGGYPGVVRLRTFPYHQLLK